MALTVESGLNRDHPASYFSTAASRRERNVPSIGRGVEISQRVPMPSNVKSAHSPCGTAYLASALIVSSALLKPPLVSEDPATLDTLSSSTLLPTICAAMPPANSPWNFLVFGFDGCWVMFTA